MADDSIPASWILIFLLLTLGLGAVAVLSVGGTLVGTAVPVLV